MIDAEKYFLRFFFSNRSNTLDLSGNQLRLFKKRITDDDFIIILELLSSYKSQDFIIKDLNLQYNEIGDSGALAISTFLGIYVD